MKITIVSRLDECVLWSCEAASLREALALAVAAGANLAGADLARADLSGEDDSERRHARMLRARKEYPHAPIVEDLDAKILAAIDRGGALEMGTWHTCETTHCRAGWAVHLAGDAGYALETRYGPGRAGDLIYLVSNGRVPNFFASNEDALADIRRCAEEGK